MLIFAPSLASIALNTKMRLALLTLICLMPVSGQSSRSSILTSFEFLLDADGWDKVYGGSSGSSATITHDSATGTVLVRANTVRDSRTAAWLDSPPMQAVTDDSTYVVIRMRHTGTADAGVLWLRTASSAPSTDALTGNSSTFSPVEWLLPPLGQPFINKSFDVVANAKYRLYAIPIADVRAAFANSTRVVTQLRLFPALKRWPAGSVAGTQGRPAAPPPLSNLSTELLLKDYQPAYDTNVLIDYIRIVTAPTVYAVSGCGLDQYFTSAPNVLRRERGQWAAMRLPTPPPLQGYDRVLSPFVRTMNCHAGGGDVITVRGRHFGTLDGGSVPIVLVHGQPCTNVTWIDGEDREEQGVQAVTCTVPPRPHALHAASLPAYPESDPFADPSDTVLVTLRHAQQSILADAKPFLRYVSPPRAPTAAPVVTNLASRSVDVVWEPPADPWHAATVTAYILEWRQAVLDDPTVNNTSPGCEAIMGGPGAPGGLSAVPATGQVSGRDSAGWYADLPPFVGSQADWSRGTNGVRVYVEEVIAHGPHPAMIPGVHTVPGRLSLAASSLVWGVWGEGSLGGGRAVTGNVTQAVLRGLDPAARYQFRIAAVADRRPSGPAPGVDAYGLLVGALSPLARVGPWSMPSCDARTLAFDFLFTAFDANNTLDHGPASLYSSTGPHGWAGGEGHYGLTLSGSATVSNCNATHTCCDGFGGRYFLDTVRFLDGWAGSDWPRNVSAYGACSEGEEGRQPSGPAPLYRYNTDTGDYSPLYMDMSHARSGADALDGASASHVTRDGSVHATRPAVPHMANNISVGQYATAGVAALRRSRLAGASDALVGRSLGRRPSSRLHASSWFSLGPSNHGVGQVEDGFWDSYDDTGSLAFVSAAEIARLDAEAAAEEITRISQDREGVFPNGTTVSGGRYIPPGVAWEGARSPDFRIAANESHWTALAYPGQDIGPLPGEFVPGPAGSRRGLESRGSRGGPGVGGGGGRALAAPQEPLRPGDSDAWATSGGTTEEDEIYGRESVLGKQGADAGALLSVDDDDPDVSNANDESKDADAQTSKGTQSAAPRRMQSGGSSTTSSSSQIPPPPLPFTRPVLRTCGFGSNRRFAHKDALGRRLVGLPSAPTSSCTSVCTGVVAPRPPILNGSPQRDGGTYPMGPLGGPVGGAQGGYSTWEEYAAVHERDHAAPSTQTGQRWHAPVSGRISRVLAGQLVTGPGQPYPLTSSAPAVVQIVDPRTELGATWAARATAPCGPALRLTSSSANQAGAGWYGRAVHVGLGFDTVWAFRMANPATHCRTLHDVATRCVSRGGAGFAFVVQTAHPGALGDSFGSGLGYAGLPSSLAVEFDTWADHQVRTSLSPHRPQSKYMPYLSSLPAVF